MPVDDSAELTGNSARKPLRYTRRLLLYLNCGPTLAEMLRPAVCSAGRTVFNAWANLQTCLRPVKLMYDLTGSAMHDLGSVGERHGAGGAAAVASSGRKTR